jgi:hypothetical protein
MTPSSPNIATLGLPERPPEDRAMSTAARLHRHLHHLTVAIGERLAGGPGEFAAADYLAAELARAGTTVRRETFPVQRRAVQREELELHYGGAWHRVPLSTFANSPDTHDAWIEAPVVLFAGATDYHRTDLASRLRGKIVLHLGCHIESRADYQRLLAAGPVALLMVDVRFPGESPLADALFPAYVAACGAVPTVNVSYQAAWQAQARGLDRARLRLRGAPVPAVSGNVIGELPGDDPDAATLYVGCHHDTQAGSPGADDNASGVAALLELAQRFYDEPVNYNILFAAFSGEEKGLIGSKTFVESPSIPKEKISFMLNMDMVGRMNSERALAVYGTGTSPVWGTVLDSANVDSLKFMYHESGVGPSDHTSFYLADIPVLHFFTGQHEDYHKPTDIADKINYDGLHSVINTVEAVVRELDGAPKLAFTKTKDQSKDSTPSFKVTLGIVPDYMYEGNGMRIDGVSEDRPAHAAGIIKGDIIVRMGDIEVNDIYAYMGGLAKFAPGETTPVTVLRGGEEKTFDVLWD